MMRACLMAGATGAILIAGIVFAETRGLVPAAFGCKAGDVSEARYCD